MERHPADCHFRGTAIRAVSVEPRMTAAKAGKIRIGISGWSYTGWRSAFYPQGLTQAQELTYAAARFPTIEINGTFYRLQRPEHFALWKSVTPDGFIFAVKGPRYITHMRRLREVDVPLANFFASGVLRLGAKLGPLLWQFPPQMRFDATRFDAFLAALPRDTDAALRLARRHDSRLTGRNWLHADVKRGLRHALEIRHDSFRVPQFVDLLRRHNVALVCADSVGWPRVMDLTADFVYCRLHGAEQLYASGYDEAALDRWAARLYAWARGREPADAERIAGPTRPSAAGRDVFVYFDNDMKVRAPADATALAQRLGATNGDGRQGRSGLRKRQ